MVTQENRPRLISHKLCRPVASQRAYVYWCFMDSTDTCKFNCWNSSAKMAVVVAIGAHFQKLKKNMSPYKITWTYSQRHFVKCTTGLVFDTTRNYVKSIGCTHICESWILHVSKLAYVFYSFRDNVFEIDKISARLQLKIEHASWRQLTRSLASGPPVETRIPFKPTRTLSGKPLLGNLRNWWSRSNPCIS